MIVKPLGMKNIKLQIINEDFTVEAEKSNNMVYGSKSTKKENHFRNSLLVAGTGLEPMTFGL